MSAALIIERSQSVLVIERTTAALSIQKGDGRQLVIQRDGVPGKDGGGGGATSTYQHTQSVAAASWNVNHNLGRWPSAVTVLSSGGVEVEADVIHLSINQLTINFSAAFAGLARII